MKWWKHYSYSTSTYHKHVSANKEIINWLLTTHWTAHPEQPVIQVVIQNIWGWWKHKINRICVSFLSAELVCLDGFLSDCTSSHNSVCGFFIILIHPCNQGSTILKCYRINVGTTDKSIKTSKQTYNCLNVRDYVRICAHIHL